jgi:hypothetical protein
MSVVVVELLLVQERELDS